MPLEIRPERPADVAAVQRLNARAFPGDAEARLVDALRAAGALTLSLVADEDGEVVGHIAFSPVTATDAAGLVFTGQGLAPMAVAPERQRGGLGGRLIAAGLAGLRQAGHPFCVVLGHPEYYPRHGFVRASVHGLRWEVPAPDEAFLVQALTPGGLTGVTGVVRYRPEFDGV